MSGTMTRFLGDSPFRVLIKLIVVSFIVGIVMAAFDWTPWDVFHNVADFFRYLWESGFAAIDSFVGYLLLGAAIGAAARWPCTRRQPSSYMRASWAWVSAPSALVGTPRLSAIATTARTIAVLSGLAPSGPRTKPAAILIAEERLRLM